MSDADRFAFGANWQSFLATIDEDRIEVEFVSGADQCDEFDSYGPWGHPSVAERDYSLAREQPPIEPDMH